MDYLAFGFSDGVGSRSSLSLQNGDQPIERRTSRLWINKLTGRVKVSESINTSPIYSELLSLGAAAEALPEARERPCLFLRRRGRGAGIG